MSTNASPHIGHLIWRVRYGHYVKNGLYHQDKKIFGAADDGAAPTVTCSRCTRPAAPTNAAAPTVTCSRSTRPATPTNETARAAGDTSRPYKWVKFVGAAHSPATPSVSICRGGW